MPPFVGAVAMQLIFGRNGTVNLLLREKFGFSVPFMEGLNGVILVQSIHYFPFILINLSASLRNIDRSMEEAAQNLGSHGIRLFRRIVFPLAMPGYIAGAALVFIKVFDDLGAPLLLNVNNMLAPQAFLRISSIGISDPMGYVISCILVLFSILSLWASFLVMRGKDYSTIQKGGGGIGKRTLKTGEKVLARHILIRTETTDIDKKKTYDTINNIKNNITNFDDFYKAAADFSDDKTSNSSGGFLGMIDLEYYLSLIHI